MLNKTLSQSDKKIMKGNPFAGSIIACALMALCCIACFTGATWAWFTSSAAVQTEDIVSAYCEIETVVKDQNGNTVQPDENGKYSFAENVRYTVTLTNKGNATTGYASFTVDGVNYCTVFLNPESEETKSVTFDVLNYGELSAVTSNWGEIESAEALVIDEDTRFINDIEEPVIKLMPASTSSTVMIERDVNGAKIAETYNADILGGTKACPYDVTATRAFDDTYGEYSHYEDDAAAYDSWFVYGIPVGTTREDLKDLIKVSNGGRYEIELAIDEGAQSAVGTGSIIKVYENAEPTPGEVPVEQFRVVIYGDVDGDGLQLNTDTEEFYNNWFDKHLNAIPYYYRALDLDLDGTPTNVDADLKNQADFDKNIDQVNGYKRDSSN